MAKYVEISSADLAKICRKLTENWYKKTDAYGIRFFTSILENRKTRKNFKNKAENSPQQITCHGMLFAKLIFRLLGFLFLSFHYPNIFRYFSILFIPETLRGLSPLYCKEDCVKRLQLICS